MAFAGEYTCSGCNKIERRDLLLAKRVQFQELGLKPKTIKSRISGWYCPSCVAKDPDWHLPPYSGPGSQATPQNERRKPARKVLRGKTEVQIRNEQIKTRQEEYDAAWSRIED